MDLRPLEDQSKTQYNRLVTHLMQSWEWGEFRKSLGLPLLRYGLFEQGKLVTVFQLTLHKIPSTNQYVGYLPKGPAPDKDLAEALRKIGKENNCALIKVEPDVLQVTGDRLQITGDFVRSPKPLFTKYNFILDLTKSENQILKEMHPKTRYNIRLAEKKGVVVKESANEQALEEYLNLYFETTNRQGYHGHNIQYHKKVWSTLKRAGMIRFLIAYYQGEPLTAWMLVNFKDTLYYPYGGSSNNHREVMASNLVAWEAIKLGKRLKLKEFDMWGALNPNPDPKDSWYGFHRFKQGYGGKLVEYIGTFDLVFNWPIYLAFTLIDRLTILKVFLLKSLGK